MSVSDALGDTSGAPVRVYVDDQEIPVIDESVTTRIRKDGPGQLTRLSDVYVPASWRGVDVLTAINGLDWGAQTNDGNDLIPDIPEDTHQIVRIEAKTNNGTYETIHYGYSRSVGSGGKGNRLRLQVGDFAHFLSNIPFGKTYRNPALTDIISDVIDKLDDRLPFVDGIQYDLPDEFASDSANVETALNVVNYQRNRDTLETALNDLSTANTLAWSFEYDPNEDSDVFDESLKLRFRELQPTVSAEEIGGDSYESQSVLDPSPNVFVGHEVDANGQEVRVLKNEALKEINPINELTAYGKTQDNGNFPIATARHVGLYERADQRGLSGPREEVDSRRLDEVEARAIKRLIERLDGASHGLMILEPTPEVRPYDTIRVKPVLSEYIEGEPPTVSYEVQRVEHHFDVGANVDEQPRTKIDVGVRVSGSYQEEFAPQGRDIETETDAPIQIVRSEEIDVNE